MKNKAQTLMVYHNQVIVNGKMYPPPKGKGCSILVKNSKVYINGYEYKKGKWVMTPRSIWYWIFG